MAGIMLMILFVPAQDASSSLLSLVKLIGTISNLALLAAGALAYATWRILRRRVANREIKS